MKKILCYILFFVLLASCMHKGQSDTARKNNSEREKIASLNIQYANTYKYEYKFGEVDLKSASLVVSVEFDKNGKPIKRSEHGDFMKYDIMKSYAYDAENKLSETIVQDYTDEITQIIRNKYEGDLNTERLFYNADGALTGKVVYKFDKNNDRVELISYDEKGKIGYKLKTVYDSKGRLKEEKEYDSDGKMKYYTKSLEDNNGCVETNRYDDSNVLQYKIITCYDNGYIKSNEYTNPVYNSYSKTEYIYDEDGLLIETINYEGHGEPSSMEKTEYIKFK